MREEKKSQKMQQQSLDKSNANGCDEESVAKSHNDTCSDDENNCSFLDNTVNTLDKTLDVDCEIMGNKSSRSQNSQDSFDGFGLADNDLTIHSSRKKHKKQKKRFINLTDSPKHDNLLNSTIEQSPSSLLDTNYNLECSGKIGHDFASSNNSMDSNMSSDEMLQEMMKNGSGSEVVHTTTIRDYPSLDNQLIHGSDEENGSAKSLSTPKIVDPEVDAAPQSDAQNRGEDYSYLEKISTDYNTDKPPSYIHEYMNKTPIVRKLATDLTSQMSPNKDGIIDEVLADAKSSEATARVSLKNQRKSISRRQSVETTNSNNNKILSLPVTPSVGMKKTKENDNKKKKIMPSNLFDAVLLDPSLKMKKKSVPLVRKPEPIEKNKPVYKGLSPVPRSETSAKESGSVPDRSIPVITIKSSGVKSKESRKSLHAKSIPQTPELNVGGKSKEELAVKDKRTSPDHDSTQMEPVKSSASVVQPQPVVSGKKKTSPLANKSSGTELQKTVPVLKNANIILSPITSHKNNVIVRSPIATRKNPEIVLPLTAKENVISIPKSPVATVNYATTYRSPVRAENETVVFKDLIPEAKRLDETSADAQETAMVNSPVTAKDKSLVDSPIATKNKSFVQSPNITKKKSLVEQSPVDANKKSIDHSSIISNTVNKSPILQKRKRLSRGGERLVSETLLVDGSEKTTNVAKIKNATVTLTDNGNASEVMSSEDEHEVSIRDRSISSVSGIQIMKKTPVEKKVHPLSTRSSRSSSILNESETMPSTSSKASMLIETVPNTQDVVKFAHIISMLSAPLQVSKKGKKLSILSRRFMSSPIYRSTPKSKFLKTQKLVGYIETLDESSADAVGNKPSPIKKDGDSNQNNIDSVDVLQVSPLPVKNKPGRRRKSDRVNVDAIGAHNEPVLDSSKRLTAIKSSPHHPKSWESFEMQMDEDNVDPLLSKSPDSVKLSGDESTAAQSRKRTRSSETAVEIQESIPKKLKKDRAVPPKMTKAAKKERIADDDQEVENFMGQASTSENILEAMSSIGSKLWSSGNPDATGTIKYLQDIPNLSMEALHNRLQCMHSVVEELGKQFGTSFNGDRIPFHLSSPSIATQTGKESKVVMHLPSRKIIPGKDGEADRPIFQRCVECLRNGVDDLTTCVFCDTCDVALCIVPCFKAYHLFGRR